MKKLNLNPFFSFIGILSLLTACSGSVGTGGGNLSLTDPTAPTATTTPTLTSPPSVPGATPTATPVVTPSPTATPAGTPSGITINLWAPSFGHAAIPNEAKRYYATVTGSSTNAITWSTSGGTIVNGPFTSGWADVQAPSSGASCTYTGTSPNYIVSSTSHFTITATSTQDTRVSATVTVNVCNPAVTVNVVPGYRVLYSGQKADLQSFVLGTVNKDVTWTILSQPTGGNATLADSVNRDTVFSATVAGRYTVKATSNGDNTKSATAILYVTGNTLPYVQTPNKTEPIDCTADPNSSGTVYEVGPARAYTSIGAVPWTTMPIGSTVRIHNDDTTGTSPTTYHEYFWVKTVATQTNPVRVVGCPDSSGNLPVIDATNATGTTNPNSALTGDSLLTIFASGYANYNGGGYSPALPNWITIEGLSLKNANDNVSYYQPNGGALTTWGIDLLGDHYNAFVSGIRVQNGYNISITGNEVQSCGIGIMTEAKNPEGQMSRWILIEGNNFHGNVKGKNTSETGTIHTLYVQSFGQVIQGNFAGNADTTGSGGDLKTRGTYQFIRYNNFQGGTDNTTRTVDFVDQQDAPSYLTIDQYLTNQGGNNDNVPLDFLAAWFEAHHNTYFYGNVVVSTVLGPVHFNADHDTSYGGVPQLGTLWYYHNTGYLKPRNYTTGWFDTNNPNVGAQITEFQKISSYNNIIWEDNASTTTPDYLGIIGSRLTFLDSKKTVTPSNACTNDQFNGGSSTGWPASLATDTFHTAYLAWGYTGGDSLSSHISGFGATGSAFPDTVATRPFSATTFAPSGMSGAATLPAALSDLPVRFQPDAVNGFMIPRTDGTATTIGGMGP